MILMNLTNIMLRKRCRAQKNTVIVNFTCPLDWLLGNQINEGVFVRVFWTRAAFELMDSIDNPFRYVWASSDLLKVWMEDKEQGGNHLFPAWLLQLGAFYLYLFLVFLALSPSISNWNLLHWLPWVSDWIMLLAFLGLQLEDDRLLDFSVSISLWNNSS